MKPWSKNLAILRYRFSMEQHILILAPAAVSVHLICIIKSATSPLSGTQQLPNRKHGKTRGPGSSFSIYRSVLSFLRVFLCLPKCFWGAKAISKNLQMWVLIYPTLKSESASEFLSSGYPWFIQFFLQSESIMYSPYIEKEHD